MVKRILVALLVLALGGGAYLYFGQDTRHDVVLRHKDRFATVREQLADLAGVIPDRPDGSFSTTSCDGLPKGARPFRFDQGDLARSNTGLVTFNQLKAPDGPAGEWAVVSPTLAEYVAATMPGYEPTDADDEWAGDDYVRSVEAMARVRYVLVVDTELSEYGDDSYYGESEDDAPEHLDDILSFDAVLADLAAREVLCTVTGAAGIDDDVWYSYRRDADEEEQDQRAVEAVDDRLRIEGQIQLEKELNSLGHGRFDLSEY